MKQIHFKILTWKPWRWKSLEAGKKAIRILPRLLGFFAFASVGIATSPVQESQLLPRSFIEEGILAPSWVEGSAASAIRVEEEPGALMVRLAGVFVTDDSSKLHPRGMPLPEEPQQRVLVDLMLGFSTAEGNVTPADKRQAEVAAAIANANVIGGRIDTRSLNTLAKAIGDITGGMVVFPDQDATNGMIQALVLGTTGAVANAPIIGAITVTDTGEGSKIVTESLKGIFLAGNVEEVAHTRLPSGVHQSASVNFPADSIKSLERYVNKTITLGTLRKMSREIISTYNKNGIPVVDVAIPDQEIENNIVAFVAVEGKVGDVQTQGGNWISQEHVQKTFADHGIAAGNLLTQSGLKDSLAELNATGFRHGDVVLRQGKEYGQSDVIVNVRDRFPVRFYWGWNNTGSKSTETERWYTGFNWSEPEPFGLPDMLSYQYQAAPNVDRYWSQSASYQLWLPWNHRLLFYGSLSQSAPLLTTPVMNLKGESQMIGGHYTIPLPDIVADNSKWKFEQSVSGGFDYKSSNSDLTFAGVQIFNQAVDIGDFLVSYDAKLTDAIGYTSVHPTLTFSPGGMFENNRDAAFLTQRPGATPQYEILAVDWERSINLPCAFEINSSGRYQWASVNLVGTEQIGIGGASTLRGFPERLVSGDDGYYIMNELRLPPLAPAKLAGFTASDLDKLVFYGFFDYGAVGPHRFEATSTVNDYTMSSAGVGFRYKLDSYLTMDLTYGFRLITPEVTDAGSHALSYSFTLAY